MSIKSTVLTAKFGTVALCKKGPLSSLPYRVR